MTHPLLNKILEKKNDRKTLISLAIISIAVIILFVFLIATRQKNTNSFTPEKSTATTIEPFEKISEFTQNATGEAISDLQANESIQSGQISNLKDQNKKLIKELQDIHTTKSQPIALQNDTPKPLSITSQNSTARLDEYQAPHVINPTQNLNAISSKKNTMMQNNGIANFSFSYNTQKTETPDQNECTPKNCILPGTFVKAVMIGAADANASVNGQSNTTPIVFDILGRGTLPNGYYSHLKGCYVLGEVYGDVSSSRGEVKLSQISCIFNGKPISKTINGTAYYLGKEGVFGNTITKNGSMLWNAGVSGMLSGLAEGVSQAQQTQSISPLGTTSSVAPNKIAMSMGANGVQTAANTLANYYIKRADQYHSVIELNSGTTVDLVFMNKFLLTPDSAQSTGALVTTPSQNGFWQHQAKSTNTNDQNNVGYGDTINSDQASTIQQQINNAGKNDDKN